jgi:glycosyltransferase involved in cell wall biosynthesis
VQAQTYQDWECIVVDDSSSDETPIVLEQLASHDARIIPVRMDRGHKQFPGIYAVLNQGLLRARGEYIARLDDDDEWIDVRKLELQIAYLDAHQDCAVVGGGMVVRDVNNVEKFRYFKAEKDADIRAGALLANPIQHPTVLMRTSALREAGGYPHQRYAEDWELWLTLGKKWKLHNLKEYFTAYEQSDRSWSYVVARPQSRAILGIITRHRKEYPGYWKGLALNGSQYLYTLLPSIVRKPLVSVLSKVKREII